MPVDTVEKRMAVAHIKRGPSKGVFPGTSNTGLGRSAIAWSYLTAETPPPVAGIHQDKFTLGTIESISVTSRPTLGGRWSW